MTDDAMLVELGRLRKRAQRERRARHEAESLAERGTRQLYERQRELELLHLIADAANGAASVEAAVQVTLDQVCAYTGCPLGHAYFVAEDSQLILVPTALWHLDHPEQFVAFREITEATPLRRGEGLPGRVFESGGSTWIVDVTQDANFPRAKQASEVGLHAAFAFPVLVGSTVAAVLEFFSREPAEPDKALLKIVAQAGTQLGRIFERKRAAVELQKVHKELLETSRQAGQAEVATGVLHNVGNVLNSVNVSSSLLANNLRKSKIANLSKVAKLVCEHETDLSAFVANDPRGKQLPSYLTALAEHLAGEQAVALEELALLQKNIDHIKDIVAMQQSFAKVSGLTEVVKVADLVDDALRMNASSLIRHDVRVFREYEANVPEISIEKHKVMQILVNLVRNAKGACDESGRADKQLTLRIVNGDGRVKIAVMDNGIGIPQENLTRIFNHGFTTKKDGHGFGLHSGALAATEMGGSLNVHSDGPAKGAIFTLELPCQKS